MKKFLTVLLLLLGLLLVSCKDDSGEPELSPAPSPAPEAPAAPEEELPDASRVGIELRELQFRYLTESEYNEGDFSEELLRDAPSFKDGDYCYAVVDLTYHKEIGSVELGDLDVRFEVPSRGVLDMRIEEAATSKITERRDESGVFCSLAFSIPSDADELKSERIILRLLAVGGGEAELSVQFGKNSSTSLVSGKSVQQITTGSREFLYEMHYTGDFYILKKAYNGTAERIEIPERLKDGVPVEAVYEYAFLGFTSLREVVLPTTLKTVGKGAFEGCTALTEINMPAVEWIGSDAFKGCTALTAVSLPSTVMTVQANAFAESLMLNYENALYLGNGENPYLVLVKVIDKTLSTYTVQANTKVIAGGAFYQCENLARMVLPASVVAINENAFRSCTALAQIEMPSVVTLGNAAFYSCKSLTAVALPDSLTTIGASAFEYCAALTEITIPALVQRIESTTFGGCVKLSSVVLPESLKFIGQFAFHACHALTAVTLPVSLTFIGHNAFNACVGLETVCYGGTAEEWRTFSGREDSWLGNSTVARIVCSDDTITL